MRYVTLGEVVELHRRLLQATGGAAGIRDFGALESAVAQPKATLPPTQVDGREPGPGPQRDSTTECQKLKRGLGVISRNPLRSWSGRPDSNRRRPAWEAGILPLNYGRVSWVSDHITDPSSGGKGLRPSLIRRCASACSRVATSPVSWASRARARSWPTVGPGARPNAPITS